MDTKTLECQVKTLNHINDVKKNLNKIILQLIKRGENHDRSKLEEPELSGFADASDLDSIEYLSPEYKESLKKLEDTIQHHYANNSHHPEFHKNGIDDFDLLDLIEMFADWAASIKRNKAGNLNFSITKNSDRFNIGPQLQKILENSVDLFND